MASGRLGKIAVAADAWGTAYTVPAGKAATANINIVNRTGGSINCTLRIRADNADNDADIVENETQIPKGGVLERTGMVMSANESVYVKGTGAISVRVHGFEEDM